MKAQLSPQLFKKLKKVDAKIRKSFKERIAIFEKSPYSPQLHNHKLKKEYQGLRSINITADYRAVYEEITIGKNTIAYFFLLGTHKELYK